METKTRKEAKKFCKLIEKHTRILLKGLTPEEKMKISLLDINRQAVELALQERRKNK